MFCLMWGPTIAAVSVILDHASDPVLIRRALDGLLTAAKIASFHHVDEVMDSLVVSLSKFTAILDPGASKPALAFGENEKARMATQTMFTIANRYVPCNRLELTSNPLTRQDSILLKAILDLLFAVHLEH